MERYFEKFPIVTYSNNQVVDITRRVVLLEKISQNPYVFYPYEIASNERADQLANRYYEDSFMSWLLYISNKMVDPYYEWYLSEDEFIEYLNKKYGSYITAQEKVKHYKNNWENQNILDVSGYNALPSTTKKYWEPIYGLSNVLTGYKRREVDWTASTNKIVSYTVSNTSFTTDEICTIEFSPGNTGRGQFVAAANNRIILQHLSGTFFTSDTVSITGSSFVYGTESGTNTIFTAVTSVANNLSEEELVYWKPVTYYDFEYERNEFNKTLRVIDSNLSQTAADNLRTLLEE